MANPPVKSSPGQPTKYRPEYPQKLIEHMGQGNSFESFAGKCRVSFSTLYNWASENPEFLEAKRTGEGLNLDYWENMARAGMTGQLRRIKSERPLLTKDEKGMDVPIRDPKTGEIMYQREYEPATFLPVPWIFTMKNRFPRLYRDRKDIAISGDGEGGPIRLKSAELTPEEKMREIREMQKFLLETAEEEDQSDVIDVTPSK